MSRLPKVLEIPYYPSAMLLFSQYLLSINVGRKYPLVLWESKKE